MLANRTNKRLNTLISCELNWRTPLCVDLSCWGYVMTLGHCLIISCSLLHIYHVSLHFLWQELLLLITLHHRGYYACPPRAICRWHQKYMITTFFSSIEPILALNICSLIACFHYLLISHFSSYYCLLLPFFEYFGNNTHYILHTTRVVRDTETNHVIPTFLRKTYTYTLFYYHTQHIHIAWRIIKSKEMI